MLCGRGNSAGVKRDFEALEKRRWEAARLLKTGLHQAEVARRLGVHRQAVSRWAQQVAQWGRAGLKAVGRAGRKPCCSRTSLYCGILIGGDKHQRRRTAQAGNTPDEPPGRLKRSLMLPRRGWGDLSLSRRRIRRTIPNVETEDFGFMASLLAFQGRIFIPGYSASRGGIRQLTKALANEWPGKGVRVKVIAAEYISTDNATALCADAKRNAVLLGTFPPDGGENLAPYRERISFLSRRLRIT